jgi:hypothetical protein
MAAAVAKATQVPTEKKKDPPVTATTTTTEDGAVEGKANGQKRAPTTTRKRAATDVAPTKAPATKRRRAGTPKKPSATAKSAPKKKKAAKPPVEDPAVSSESDSSDDEEESSSSSSDDDAKSPNGATASDILHQPRRQMTDRAIDELVPLILKNENVAEDKLLVISSVNAQAVLSRYFHKKEVDETNVYTLLGVTRERVDNADCIAVVTHGPHTEEVRTARLMYDNSSVDNYHWSLVCWFRSAPSTCFHYDSMPKVNDRRCREVVSVFRRLGVFPKSITSVTVPDFFPEQEQEWECGYELLIALTIIAGKRAAIAAITDDDVEITYRPFFSSLATGGVQAPFLRRLRELLAREKYAS